MPGGRKKVVSVEPGDGHVGVLCFLYASMFENTSVIFFKNMLISGENIDNYKLNIMLYKNIYCFLIHPVANFLVLITFLCT